MRTVTVLAAEDGFVVRRVEIRSDTGRWWPPEIPSAYRVTLVRRGVFRARVHGRTLLADPAVGYAGRDEIAIAHRPGTVDVCTAIDLSQPYLTDLTGGVTPPAQAPVTGSLAVAHRMLAARARAGAEPFELAERLAVLVGGLLTGPVRAPRPLVDAARELINADPAALGLRDLAARIGCSPYHLSRAFHAETGLTLTAYRARIRVLHALEALEAGHPDLSALAADLGFADHAHLTRTVRRACGHTPSALRRRLRNDVQARDGRTDADSSPRRRETP